MLLFLIILCGLCSAWSQEEKVTLLVPPAVVLNMRKIAEGCAQQHGVDVIALKQMVTWTIPNDMPHKQFMLCVCLKSEYMKEDGTYNINKMMDLIPADGKVEEFRKYLEDCNKQRLENDLENVYKLGACLHKSHNFRLNQDEFEIKSKTNY